MDSIISFNTPILLITFNRPEHTRAVLERIISQQPSNLYIFQDGAREGNYSDKTKMAEVRQVIDSIACSSCITNIHTFFSDINLGCGLGPKTAIDWFFKNESQGIIIEDDCIPCDDFYEYCADLLSRYEYDSRIALIGGTSYGPVSNGCSYSFCSGHQETWGWASWRRAWALHDYKLDGIDEELFKKLLKQYSFNWKQREYWWSIWKMVKKDQMNGSCWDYQFYWSFWKKNMFAICPTANLVSNVGSGDDATHTKADSPMMSLKTNKIMPLVHPTLIKLDKEYENRLMRDFVHPYDYGQSGIHRLPYLMSRYLKRILGHDGPWIKK